MRHYQQSAINQVRDNLKAGNKKIMVYLPTGSGKTHIFTEQVKTCLSKQKKILILVRRRQIAFQTLVRITEHLRSKNIGLYMGDYRCVQPCTIASIDTVVREPSKLKYFDVVIVDECHDAMSEGYQKVLKAMDSRIIVGYTATPFRIDGKGHKFWDAVVRPITASQLREQGFLCPLRILAPSKPGKMATAGGDFTESEMIRQMDKGVVYGKIIDEYTKNDCKGALCFAVNVKHSKEIAYRFIKAGIAAVHVDANSPQSFRDECIKRLKRAKAWPFVLCNVNIFSTGVDVPEVETIIMARPTKSRVLYMQQIGRGMRPAKDKKDCLILDHAGNALRFGSPYEDFEPELTDANKRAKSEPDKFKACRACAFVMPIALKTCPACDEDLRSPREVMLDQESELVEWKGEKFTLPEMQAKVKAHERVLTRVLHVERNVPMWYVRQKLRAHWGQHYKGE